MNILILNAHWNNRGDEAAIRAMIDSFMENMKIKNMNMMILSENISFFPYEKMELLDPYPSLINKSSILSNIILCIDIMISLITLGKCSITNRGKFFLSSIDSADVVIHAPGGPSIGDIYKGKYGIIEIFYLYRLLIPILKGKQIFFYAPSMGPFSGKIKNILRKLILIKARAIIVREQISSKYLKNQLGLDSYVTLDSSFQNDINRNYLDRYSNLFQLLNIIKNEKVIGMTITDLKWHPVYKNNISLRKNIVHSLFELTNFLISKGYFILLIPQLFGEQEKEILFIKYIHKLNKEKILILPLNVDSYGQQIIISKLYCIIGMRYHPNIFAAKGNVPSIAISYEHKTNGFMNKLKRNDLLLNVEEIDKFKIIEKFKYLEKNYNYLKMQITNRTPILKNESKKTTDIIRRILRM